MDPRGLNMNCNVLDALGLNFRTDFVTCEDCPTCSTCSSCLTCSTCLTWTTFLSVEQGCPHNGPKTEYFFKFRFWPDNFANWTILKLWKKLNNFKMAQNYDLQSFASALCPFCLTSERVWSKSFERLLRKCPKTIQKITKNWPSSCRFFTKKMASRQKSDQTTGKGNFL